MLDPGCPFSHGDLDQVKAVGETLEWASLERLTVLTCGAGTKIGWGPSPGAIDVRLSTARLDKVVAHRHGDLTATVQAVPYVGMGRAEAFARLTGESLAERGVELPAARLGGLRRRLRRTD